MEKPIIRISVRNLVEFILRSGDLTSGGTTAVDKEAMLKGSRLHRKIQKQMGSTYQAEVPLKKERTALFCNYPSENREYLRPYEVWVSLD